MDQAKDNGCTPLIIATAAGHEAIARLLCDRGAKIDKVTNDGRTPLLAAAHVGGGGGGSDKADRTSRAENPTSTLLA